MVSLTPWLWPRHPAKLPAITATDGLDERSGDLAGHLGGASLPPPLAARIQQSGRNSALAKSRRVRLDPAFVRLCRRGTRLDGGTIDRERSFRLLLAAGIGDAKIMLRVLVVAFRGNSIFAAQRVLRQRQIALV